MYVICLPIFIFVVVFHSIDGFQYQTCQSRSPATSILLSNSVTNGRRSRWITKMNSATNSENHGLIQLGRVTMYKKEGCPYCMKAKELLEGKYLLNIVFVDIESPQREEILQQMRTFSGGRNTVPQIFFNAEHLGGNDDVQKLEIDGILANKVDFVRKNAVTMMQDHWFHPWY